MIDLDDALAALRIDVLKIAQLERDRIDLLNSPFSLAMKDERDQGLKREIEQQRRLLLKVLDELINFPPHHARHRQLLAQFYGVAAFDKSVFIMTKFPDPKMPKIVDAELSAVIEAVRAAIQSCGYTARVASDNQYHNILWDNVELHLLGCKRGVAIVEDKYLPELNPNVAMEWGWMRGMGRNVLYLVEKSFKKERADWGGLIQATFEWQNPKPDIEAGVKAWLNGQP